MWPSLPPPPHDLISPRTFNHINGTRGWYRHNLHQGATWGDQRHQFGHSGANSPRFISQICHWLAESSRAPAQNLIFICKWIAYICKFKRLNETMYIKGLDQTLAHKPCSLNDTYCYCGKFRLEILLLNQFGHSAIVRFLFRSACVP